MVTVTNINLSGIAPHQIS